MQRIATSVLLCASLIAAPSGLHSQAQRSEPRRESTTAGLRERMRAFLHAVEEGNDTVVASFFPSEGEWTWVHTTHSPSAARVGIWRFRGSETLAAMSECGPLFRSFLYNPHGQPIGSIRYWVMDPTDPWRHAGGQRFVPPASAREEISDHLPRPAAFVQWRIERGRWVVSAFGDESVAAHRRVGPTASGARHPPAGSLVAPVYAEGLTWYQEHQPLQVEGHRYVKYGIPRPLEPSQLEPFSWHGPVQIFVERGRVSRPDIIYVPASADTYQPYETYTVYACPL